MNFKQVKRENIYVRGSGYSIENHISDLRRLGIHYTVYRAKTGKVCGVIFWDKNTALYLAYVTKDFSMEIAYDEDCSKEY